MNPVRELQRRSQKAGFGNPVYQTTRLGGGLASCVYVGGEPFSVFHTKSAKQGRRMVASCALFELFDFCRAIVVSERNPLIELVHWLPPSCLGSFESLADLLDTKCPIYVVGDIKFPSCNRVARFDSLVELLESSIFQSF